MSTDFLNFEKLFFDNNSFENNNFYSLLNDPHTESALIFYLKNSFLEQGPLDTIFIGQITNLSFFLKKENINYSNFSYFKSEIGALDAYLFLFLLKTFSVQFKINTKNEDYSTPSFREFLFDRNDFINTFLDYLYKFFIFIEIKTKNFFNFSKEYLRKFIFRYVELLVKNNLISITDVREKKKHYKSLTFNLNHISYIPHIAFYTDKFETYIRSDREYFSYNKHFFSLIEITKKAKYNDSGFKAKTEQISILHERSFMIDRSLLNSHFSLLMKNQNLQNDENLTEHFKNFSTNINKFTKEKDLESLKFYHSKLSKFLTLIRIKTILDMKFDDLKLYLPFMFCFRGRVYELTNLSFTFYKEFRFCLYNGFYEKEEETFHPINSQVHGTIDSQFSVLSRYDWFNELSLIRKRACAWCFLSLGALEKVELGKKVHVSLFIQKGVEVWERCDAQQFRDVYDQMEANYLKFLIKELKDSSALKKWLFWKDAPASCFQHLLQILGPFDENSYKICNLDSADTWYDPYSYLIADFFEKNFKPTYRSLEKKTQSTLNEKNFFDIFSRKRLKKIFMTESYGAGYKKLTSFFIVDLNLDNFNETERTEVMRHWEDLFEYISNENILFSQSSKEIIKYFEKNEIKKIINPDDSEVDFSCFKVEIRQFEIYVEKKRHTLQKREISTNEDRSQYKTSVRANFVHTRDALLARSYIAKTNMWTVHDCFSIDLLNISFMLALLNELMNGEFYEINIHKGEKKIIYSFFLVL